MASRSAKPMSARIVIPAVVALMIGAGALITCQNNGFGRKRLVEVFDNGPVGGPQGSSEGYIWVGVNDDPPPGKSWKPTDPDVLTASERARIR